MTIPELKPIEGKYEILEKLNEGGMGAVYKVRHRLLEEIRVIKVIRPQLQADDNLRRRFLREARAAVRLRHPNIAELFDFTVADDGTAYMVIEFIDGVDLAHLIEKGPLPGIGLVLDIAIQSLRALAYLHRKQFVHRDISPDNLMLTKDVEGRPLVKLIDLGIAKPLKSDMNLTGEGLFLGKVRYASPEQFGGQSGKEEIDQRSDLYSFGIVLYELLTGVHPITGNDNQTVLAGHLFHPPRSFEESDPQNRVPEGLRTIVMKALEKTANDRFPDAPEFARELADFESHWVEDDTSSASLDATLIGAARKTPLSRPGSTQDRLDAEFAPHPTPPPHPLEAVPPAEVDRHEALLQSCCDKIESLLTGHRLMEAEVELHRGLKTLGRSVLLEEYSKRIDELKELLHESLVRAQLLRREGDFETALGQLELAREIDLENSELSALETEIRQAFEHREREIESSRREIEAQLEAGRPEEAQKRLALAVETFGRFAHLEDLQDRIASLLSAAQKVRRIGAAASEIGGLIEAGNLPQASAALTAAIRTHGEDEMFSELADQIASLEERERQRIRAALEAEKQRRIKSHLELAAHFADADNFEEARQQLEEAASIDPENLEVRDRLNQLEKAATRHEQLRQRAQRLQETTSQIQGQIESGDLDAAEQVLQAAEAELGADHELAALRARIDERRLEKQERAAGEALKEAYRYFKGGRLEEAKKTIDQALMLSPGLPQAVNLQQRVVERLTEMKAREARQQEIRQAAEPIEKLILKNRLKRASTALAEAVRKHGQDPRFDELRNRMEDLAKREKEARRILAADVGHVESRVRPVAAIAAALILGTVALFVYWFFLRPTQEPHKDDGQEVQPAEVIVPLDSLLAGKELGEFYALVVGVNDYENGLTDLETAVTDAQQLAASLETQYGFSTDLLLNASRYEMLSALESYIDRLTDQDNLLVFYAGHGFVDEVTGRGYWQLRDAEPDNTANWISSLEVADILLDVPAKRVLVVADSCFSGAFSDPEAAGAGSLQTELPPTEVVERLDLRARQVLSSGNLQPVLDNGVDGHSVFSRALLSALEKTTGALEARALFERIRQDVDATTLGMELQQQPQLAPLDSDNGGVFLLVPSKPATV